jgi:hypothetical protein
MSHLIGRRSDAAHAIADSMQNSVRNCIGVSRVTGKSFIIKGVAFELCADTPPLGTSFCPSVGWLLLILLCVGGDALNTELRAEIAASKRPFADPSQPLLSVTPVTDASLPAAPPAPTAAAVIGGVVRKSVAVALTATPTWREALKTGTNTPWDLGTTGPCFEESRPESYLLSLFLL